MITALASEQAPPTWTVFPFAAFLLVIAITPLFFGHFWEKNRNKLLLAVLASLPVLGYLLFRAEHGGEWLHHSLREYVAFIALLASLFIISGGVYLRGSLAGTPAVNTSLLGVGAILASFIGTTGASMLLIRPLLRANEKRARRVHLVIFFIFIVSNGAGMLTPLGDPPLFLGFLRGVPFFWTLQLLLPWLLVNGILLALFYVLDSVLRSKEGIPNSSAGEIREPLRVEGGLNFLWLLGVIGVIYVMGKYGHAISPHHDVQAAVQVGGMLAMAALSLALTPRPVREANRFGWHPIIEVAALFIGIFITMVPALKFLEAKGASGEIQLTRPWQFFWMTGALSSFLDNAPTYLTFATLATGVVNKLTGAALSAENLGALAAHPLGASFLKAVSCGAVFMGANTYIGNGPNFMVKAIAEENGVRMPSFFGYMLWSCGILLPLFGLVTLLFFRS
ncbi:MAG TPA: sodium:proton antiporter [Planctomycetota bacterium]|jgi:Na+/H+ antiporter NhaD/arsenite permease-like protein|nr:sodium:proton antiporter [Planctomycetota bacterium]